MLKKAVLLSTLALVAACSDDEGLPSDSSGIDLSRGGYSCYTMSTNYGDVQLAIDVQRAPITAANFDTYVSAEFYDGLIFHRVIDGFMIQGGAFNTALEFKTPGSAIENESTNGLKNYRGRLAMARTSSPHSATSQFFINTVNNHFLDNENANDGWGYAVFGGVIDGMDVVDTISALSTSVQQATINGSTGDMSDVPDSPAIMEQISKVSCPAS